MEHLFAIKEYQLVSSLQHLRLLCLWAQWLQMQSETMSGSADGSVKETLSAMLSRPSAHRHGHCGSRGRD